MRRFFVETFTLDADTEGGDNENDEQLNTRTDDHQPAHAEAMEITPDHPVYVEGKGWLWAENLAVGDRLRRADGGMAKVLAVERVKLTEPELVYNFTVKGPHTYFVLEVGVLVHNSNVTQCDFNLSSERWHATEEVTINGRQYKKGQFIPANEVYTPRRKGISEEMERAIMENLPEGHVLVLRDRPLGAFKFEGMMDAKKGWVRDWMVLKKHPGGVRELIDANKAISGEYDHVKLAYHWNDKLKAWEQGYNFYNPKKPNELLQFVPSKGKAGLSQYVPDSTPHNNIDVFKLTGQNTLSDIDAAIYANRSGSLNDDIFMKEFGAPFNSTYLGRLADPHYTISHGALYEGLTNKPDVLEKLSKIPGRVEALEAEDVIIFANLPDKNMVGYIGVLPYKDAVERYAKPWTWD